MKRPGKPNLRLLQNTGVSDYTENKYIMITALFPYKIQLSWLLSKEAIIKSYAFANKYIAVSEYNPDVLNTTWFSDEYRFNFGKT
jgi:hypothetical protein